MIAVRWSQHDRKYKRKNYTSEIYGVRLLFEDARIFDDYGKVKEYLLHCILSFSDRREYNLLGDDKEDYRSEIVRYIRSSLAAGIKEISVSETRWVAGLHLNIDNPHVQTAAQQKCHPPRATRPRPPDETSRRSRLPIACCDRTGRAHSQAAR